MNAFTIDADNNITVHATKKAARETGAGIFDTAESLADLIGADNERLVKIWNSLTGVTPVKKFASRAVAARRIFAEVQKLTPTAPGTRRTRRRRHPSRPRASTGQIREESTREGDRRQRTPRDQQNRPADRDAPAT
jgi:hypothetical protein